MPSRAQKARIAEATTQEAAFLEWGPPAWRRKLEAAGMQVDGETYYPLDHFHVLLEAMPVWHAGRERLSPDVNPFWRLEYQGKFPMQVRRAYEEDPEVWDATFLVAACLEWLRHGRFLLDKVLAEEQKNPFEYRLPRRAFQELLRYGPETWAKDVEGCSTYLKRSQRLLLSRAGVDLLLRIMPLRSRALLQIGGPEHTEDDLWKTVEVTPGFPPLVVRCAYKTDLAIFDVNSIKRLIDHFYVSEGEAPPSATEFERTVRRVRRDHDLTEMRQPYLGEPRGYPAPLQHQAGQKIKQSDAKAADLEAAESAERNNVLAEIEAANMEAREKRLAQRRGPTTSLTVPSAPEVAEREPRSPPVLNRAARRRARLRERRAQEQRCGEKLRRALEASAFLRECAPAFLDRPGIFEDCSAEQKPKPSKQHARKTREGCLPKGTVQQLFFAERLA